MSHKKIISDSQRGIKFHFTQIDIYWKNSQTFLSQVCLINFTFTTSRVRDRKKRKPFLKIIKHSREQEVIFFLLFFVLFKFQNNFLLLITLGHLNIYTHAFSAQFSIFLEFTFGVEKKYYPLSSSLTSEYLTLID